jgi:hypothetical protein
MCDGNRGGWADREIHTCVKQKSPNTLVNQKPANALVNQRSANALATAVKDTNKSVLLVGFRFMSDFDLEGLSGIKLALTR